MIRERWNLRRLAVTRNEAHALPCLVWIVATFTRASGRRSPSGGFADWRWELTVRFRGQRRPQSPLTGHSQTGLGTAKNMALDALNSRHRVVLPDNQLGDLFE